MNFPNPMKPLARRGGLTAPFRRGTFSGSRSAVGGIRWTVAESSAAGAHRARLLVQHVESGRFFLGTVQIPPSVQQTRDFRETHQD